VDATLAIGPGEGTLSDGQITLTQFASEHSLALTRFAFLLCADHQLAEDLVQDAFVSLYRRFGETLPIAAPVAYARRAIVNAQISRSRKRFSSETITDRVPDTTAEGHDSSDQDAMWRVLAALPDRQRAVLVLRYYLDLTDTDIAAALGCRSGTVRSLATRAFATLRSHPDLATIPIEEPRP
jgi:RNA polymerase sigma-70 factor (sigma-E family)